MTTETLTITAFIEQRIAEDEAAANDPGNWNEYDLGDPFDPARVLATCKAHRAIVELHKRGTYRGHRNGEDVTGPADWCDGCGGEYAEISSHWPCPTLRALASIWSDHPTWREEWAL